jgi:hypothetical protein
VVWQPNPLRQETSASAVPYCEAVSFNPQALGALQIDNTEDDAFRMLGSAIIDAVADDEEHTAGLFEVWSDLEELRKLS